MKEPAIKAARILIVDDEPDIPEVLVTSLSAHGFEIRSADDGEIRLRGVSSMATGPCDYGSFNASHGRNRVM